MSDALCYVNLSLRRPSRGLCSEVCLWSGRLGQV